MRDDDIDAALRTCHLRGWVEPVSDDAIPTGLAENLQTGRGPLFDKTQLIYRLTDSGWNVIHDNHSWVVATFIVAAAALIASILRVVVQG